MQIQYIIEICVAIDIAILGISYPIIVDKISNIGEKYSSQYISELFESEFPQRSIKINFLKRQYKFSIFKSALYLTIVSFLFLIFKFDPLFGWNNWMINNSAKLIVLVATTILTILFFIWLDKVVLFNGKSSSLLKRIVSKYESLTTDTELRSYHLKSINELTFYAIDKQDEHLQETLLKFYSHEFFKIRKDHDKTKPLIYPVDLYFLVNKLNMQLANSQNKKLLAIEHRAVSGAWLLGGDFEHVIISIETYRWLWQNLYTIYDKEKFIRMYWATVSQYFDYRLKYIPKDFDFQKSEFKNGEEIKKRDEERDEFSEFHYALGGLLLYGKQYSSIKYLFSFSQSQPPSYPLLPHSMTEIFQWFEHFRNEFNVKGELLDTKYYYPGLDNLGTQGQIIYWICSYLCLLFIRQYTLNTYYVYQDHTSQPQLPDDIIELSNWLDTTSYFKSCLNKVLSDEALIGNLQYDQIVEKQMDNFDSYLENLKNSIIAKIGTQKLYASLSVSKVDNFEKTSNQIISQAFGNYDNVLNSAPKENKNSNLTTTIKGGTTLMTKSAFIDNDYPHMNYNSIFAEQISENIIQILIPNSFFQSATKKYLLNKNNIITALEKIIENNEMIIVGINCGYDLKELLKSKFEKSVQYIRSTQYQFQDVLFVLNKMDLPYIEHKDLSSEEIKKLQLTLINNDLKLYVSVIDINTPENAEF